VTSTSLRLQQGKTPIPAGRPHQKEHTNILKKYMYAHILKYHPAREASWRGAFSPYALLLLNLYHYLKQKQHFGLVPENQFLLIRGRY